MGASPCMCMARPRPCVPGRSFAAKAGAGGGKRWGPGRHRPSFIHPRHKVAGIVAQKRRCAASTLLPKKGLPVKHANDTMIGDPGFVDQYSSFGRNSMSVSQELLAILACPACKERPPVVLADDQQALVCTQCGRHYPIRDDIPVMLVEEATIPAEAEPRD